MNLLFFVVTYGLVSAYPQKWFEAHGSKVSGKCESPSEVVVPIMGKQPVNGDASLIKFYKKGDATKAVVSQLSSGSFMVELTGTFMSLAYIPLGSAPLSTKFPEGAQDNGCQMVFTLGYSSVTDNSYQVDLQNSDKPLKICLYWADVSAKLVNKACVTIPAASVPTAATEKPTAAAEKPTAAAEKPTAAAEKPTAAAEKPTAAAEKPTAAAEKPTAAAEKPTAAAEKPTAAAEKPTAAAEKPTAAAEKPTAAEPADSSANVITPWSVVAAAVFAAVFLK